MAIIDGFPAQSGVVDPVELGKDLAGLIVRNTSNVPRPGVLAHFTTAIVSTLASMNVAVGAFNAVLVRGGRPVLICNDGTTNVAIGAAPASNSRIDVIYVRQKEDGYGGFADGSNGPELGVAAGTPAASPVKPSIPTGALELATLLVPAGVATTNAGGVVLTNTYQYTALTGDPIPVRDATELGALTGYSTALVRALRLDNRKTYRMSPPNRDATGWWAEQDVQHWEWAYSAATLASGSVTGLGGTVAVDSGRTTDTDMVTYLGAGVFNIEKKGIYAVSATESLSAVVSGARSFLDMTVTGGAPLRFHMGSGDDTVGGSAVFRVNADDDDITITLFQNSGSSRTAAGRVTITRLGDIT